FADKNTGMRAARQPIGPGRMHFASCRHPSHISRRRPFVLVSADSAIIYRSAPMPASGAPVWYAIRLFRARREHFSGAFTMSDKAASIIQKAAQERKRAQFGRALKRLEAGIAAHPEEIDLYLEAIDTAIEGGELPQATNLLKTVQDKFARERERVQQFVREKLRTVHDPS